ncbi:MAG TPA: DUF2254 domain-containing protein [Bacillales bacterium]|nr:DUF2254 domain-containing protein [Bacillales bacterium]
MKRTKMWLKIRESFWFLPALYGIISILLAIFSVTVDFSFSKEKLESAAPDILVSNTKLGTTILSTLLQSILTMATIAFSTIMVVLTTFSGQFSPRTLQNFVSDRITQRILAIFVSGVIYNLVTLLEMNPSVKRNLLVTPVLSVLIGMTCVAAFVYFINHVAKWVQVNNLIDKLTNEALETIQRIYHDIQSFQQPDQINDQQEDSPDSKKHIAAAERNGYIELIDFGTLMKLAHKDNTVIHLNVYVGSYVMQGNTLFTYQYEEKGTPVNEQKYARCLKLGTERTGMQDIEFQIQKLVEIALRAISPAINDPHTAINCINRIGLILKELSQREDFPSSLYDNEGNRRIELKKHDFAHYLYKAFYQIRHYGKEDISVTTAMFHVLKRLAEQADPEVKKEVLKFRDYIYEGFDQEVLLSLDETYLQKELDELEEMARSGNKGDKN